MKAGLPGRWTPGDLERNQLGQDEGPQFAGLTNATNPDYPEYASRHDS